MNRIKALKIHYMFISKFIDLIGIHSAVKFLELSISMSPGNSA